MNPCPPSITRGIPYQEPAGPGRPDSASRRLTDLLRSEQARQRREEAAARQIPPGQWLTLRAVGGLLEMAGHRQAAREAYQAAARRTMSLPHRRYLNDRAARLAGAR